MPSSNQPMTNEKASTPAGSLLEEDSRLGTRLESQRNNATSACIRTPARSCKESTVSSGLWFSCPMGPSRATTNIDWPPRSWCASSQRSDSCRDLRSLPCARDHTSALAVGIASHRRMLHLPACSARSTVFHSDLTATRWDCRSTGPRIIFPSCPLGNMN